MSILPPITAEDARWLGPLLGFRPSVAARFERDNGAQRVRQLRQAICLGLVFFNVYNVTAAWVMPDVLRLALTLRLLVVTPLALLLAWSLGRLPHTWRENLVTAAVIGVTAVPISLLWLSKAPLAGFAAAQTYLMMAFATMMLMLRFAQALNFVLATVVMAIPSYCFAPGIPAAAASELLLHLVSAAFFVLYGSYRLERSVRQTYLLATQAALRSEDLQVDNTALERLSLVDPLTGIANRRRLTEWLARRQAQNLAERRTLAVVMVDVDHFKRYNDHYGHLAGDVCLQRIAGAMSGCVRDDGDLLARYGGEEFVIVLPGASTDEAAAVAERLCEAVVALRLPHEQRGDGGAWVTVSAGVATSASDAAADDLGVFEAADAALFAAKRAGRNRHATEPAPVTSIRRDD